MGFKVNFFVLVIALYAIPCKNYSCLLLVFTSTIFILVHQYWKTWKFIEKFPGGRTLPIARRFLENSASGFYAELNRQWRKYGCDKFVMWVGFERFVTVSKWRDVKAVLSATDDQVLAQNYKALWPWMGGDCLKSSDFNLNTLAEFTTGPFNAFINSNEFLEEVSRKIQAFYHQNLSNGDVVDMEKMIRVWMFDTVWSIATGINLGYKKKELFEEAERLIKMADQRLYSGWQQSSLLRRISGAERSLNNSQRNFNELVSKIIAGNAEKSTVKSLHDVLAQSEREIDIPGFIASFIVLGYDRMATALNSAIYEMAKNPKMYSGDAEKLLFEVLKRKSAVPVVYKFANEGIAINGCFIPPETNVLIYLDGSNACTKLLESSSTESSVATSILKLFMEIFLQKYSFRAEKSEVQVGCGISLRQKGAKISIRGK